MPSALDPEVIARAAAVIGSCWPDDGVDRNAGYLWNARASVSLFYYRLGAQAECLANASCGCEALVHCVGLGLTDPREGCVSGCDGDVFSACGIGEGAEPFDFGIDCGALGLSCDPDAICSDGPAASCDTEFPSCGADGRVEICDDDFMRRGPVCADYGLACESGECVGSGAECTGDSFSGGPLSFSGVSCSGAVLSACVGGRLHELDCTSQGPGFTCQLVDGRAFCGLSDECLPGGNGSGSATHRSGCDGAMLSFCNAGRLEQVNCVELGFSGCDVAPSAGHYGCVPSRFR